MGRRLLVALTVALSFLAGAVSAQEGEVVVDVLIEGGNLGVDRGLLGDNLATRPGRPYRRSLVDEDIRWLHDTYGLLVDDVLVEPGPVVTFRLRRISQYDEVRLVGNDRYSDSKLRTVAQLQEGQGATPDEVVRARLRILDHYLSKSHPFAEVGVKLLPRASDGRRTALLEIFEGPRTEISALNIEGLTAIPVDNAVEVLRSAPGFWSWLVGKDFVRTDVDRDVVVLERFVRGEGYLDARAALQRLDFSPDRTEVEVTLLVEEGERYHVGTVEVEGNTYFTAGELLEDSKLVTGAPYRTPDASRVMRSIRSAYGRAGYIDVEAWPIETFDLEEPVVNITWHIEENSRKRVRDILVKGNQGTRDSVVRRYLTVYPGDIVDTSELRYSEDALISLNYFTDLTGVPKVKVSTEPTPDDELVDVVVEVDDSSSGLFTFVVGAGSDSGLFGGVTVDKRNFDITKLPSSWSRFLPEFFGGGEAFHGGGQRLSFELLPGTETTNFDITFSEPWLDESEENPWGLTVELYDRRRLFTDYSRDATGVGVFFDHRFNREHSLSFGPRIETLDIFDVDDDTPDVVTGELTEFAKEEGTAQRRVIEAAWRYNDVDSLFEPTDGFTSRVRTELVGSPLGGDVDALRVEWNGELFMPVRENDEGHVTVFHPRLALGVVEQTTSNEVPFYENIFVGGATGPYAVRGFNFQGVGPQQRLKGSPLGPVLTDKGGTATGGRLAAVASMEMLFPLVTEYNPFRDRDEIMMKGVLFVDAGNLVQEARVADLADDWRLAAGAGIRLRLPALGGITMLLDWAQVLAKEEEDDTRAFSFELSRRF